MPSKSPGWPHPPRYRTPRPAPPVSVPSPTSASPLATDTAPQSMIEALRWTAVVSKIVDRRTEVATAADVFNAATLGGARALGRDDLGRIAPGAADAAHRQAREGAWGSVAAGLAIFVLLPILAVLALVTEGLRASRQGTQQLIDERERVGVERARRVSVEERARIARELHDVVAHHMSMVAVRAETAPYRVHGLSQETRSEFAEISTAARASLNEIRSLLTLLRGDETPRMPQPHLAHVDALVADGSLASYHLLPSVRGDLLAKLGRQAEAKAEFERAAGLTRNARERQLLLERAAACARGPAQTEPL